MLKTIFITILALATISYGNSLPPTPEQGVTPETLIQSQLGSNC